LDPPFRTALIRAACFFAASARRSSGFGDGGRDVEIDGPREIDPDEWELVTPRILVLCKRIFVSVRFQRLESGTRSYYVSLTLVGRLLRFSNGVMCADALPE